MSQALGGSPARSFEAESYDGRTILFHWLTMILVAGQWLGAHAIDWFPRGPLRVDARSTHILVGSFLALLILVRLTWRFSGGRRLPPADEGALRRLASFVHGLLYVLVIATVTLGLFNAWVRGDSLFGLLNLPKFPSSGSVLRERCAAPSQPRGQLDLRRSRFPRYGGSLASVRAEGRAARPDGSGPEAPLRAQRRSDAAWSSCGRAGLPTLLAAAGRRG